MWSSARQAAFLKGVHYCGLRRTDASTFPQSAANDFARLVIGRNVLRKQLPRSAEYIFYLRGAASVFLYFDIHLDVGGVTVAEFYPFQRTANRTQRLVHVRLVSARNSGQFLIEYHSIARTGHDRPTLVIPRVRGARRLRRTSVIR